MKRVLINFKIISCILVGLISSHATAKAKTKSKTSWVYFDLGDTVIDTKGPEGIRYFKGARQYIENLHQRGLKVGLISNIPETFGIDYKEKLKTLKEYVAKNWAGDRSFDWGQFDEIFLPLNNSELKPAEIMYVKAMARADHCPIAYISENLAEVEKAQSMGIAGHLFTPGKDELYIPLEAINEFIEYHYTNEVPDDCL